MSRARSTVFHYLQVAVGTLKAMILISAGKFKDIVSNPDPTCDEVLVLSGAMVILLDILLKDLFGVTAWWTFVCCQRHETVYKMQW